MEDHFLRVRVPNPGDRPKALGELQELARQHTAEAIAVLVQIMRDEKALPSARVAAANALIIS